MKMMMSSIWILFLFSVAGFSNSVDGSQVVELKEENWEKMLDGEWMVEFYAPWCPACRALESAWEEFSTWSDDLNLNGIAKVDVTTSPGLSGRFLVTALPTIIHVKDGHFRQYRGSRDKDAFISFIEEEKWKEIEEISPYKDPRSIQMTCVSYFFKMSMYLRTLHTTITEEYGFPYWASYVGFALITIILGAILGLILVCCIDFVYPPSAGMTPPPVNVTQKSKYSDIEDETEELEEEESAPAPSQTGGTARRRKAKKAE